MLARGILEAVGGTPLVLLERMFPGAKARVWAKLESLNPGGSVKDRPALAIISDAIERGLVGRDTVVIESSSGNMGIGLAQACRYHGMRFLCVVDSKTTAQNIQILNAYGAEVVKVEGPDPESGELLQARLAMVRRLMGEIGDAFWPNQYENANNPAAHYRTTMQEVWDGLNGEIDYVFAATSTFGTVRGCAEFLRSRGSRARMVAVDAVGSRIFHDHLANRRIPGFGAGLRPPLFDASLVDRCIHVDDLTSVIACRRLLRREAILAGGSSGGVLAGVERMLPELPEGVDCVAILCDRGERYLDTVFSDEWVCDALGEDAALAVAEEALAPEVTLTLRLGGP